MKSLALIEELLKYLGETEVKEIMSPFRKLHDLRTKMKGHAANKSAAKIRRELIREYGDLKRHFWFLVEDCREFLLKLKEQFDRL